MLTEVFKSDVLRNLASGYGGLNRDFFSQTAKRYGVEWDKIEDIPANYLVNLLSMNLEFSGIEKQTLLESPDLDTRLDDLICLMEMLNPNEVTANSSPNFLT